MESRQEVSGINSCERERLSVLHWRKEKSLGLSVALQHKVGRGNDEVRSGSEAQSLRTLKAMARNLDFVLRKIGSH